MKLVIGYNTKVKKDIFLEVVNKLFLLSSEPVNLHLILILWPDMDIIFYYQAPVIIVVATASK